MKRILLSLIPILLICFLLVPGVKAQEKKAEKRIKIVRVDENGKKVVIDTLVTDDMELEDLDLPEDIKIRKYKGDKSGLIVSDSDVKGIYITVDEEGKISTDEEKDILIKEGNMVIVEKDDDNIFTIHKVSEDDKGHKFITYTITEGDTVKHKSRIYSVKNKNFSWVIDEDGLADDEMEVIIRSSDEEEVIKIKGDAVIRIVDGKVKIEAGEVSKEMPKKVVKKKK